MPGAGVSEPGRTPSLPSGVAFRHDNGAAEAVVTPSTAPIFRSFVPIESSPCLSLPHGALPALREEDARWPRVACWPQEPRKARAHRPAQTLSTSRPGELWFQVSTEQPLGTWLSATIFPRLS